jgi:hypothetical protein
LPCDGGDGRYDIQLMRLTCQLMKLVWARG